MPFAPALGHEEPLKIVFVSKEYPPSARSYGIGTYVAETAAALSRAGHRVTVLAASDDNVAAQDRMEGGVRVVRIPDAERNVPGPLTWKALRKSGRLGVGYSIRALRKARELGIVYRTAVARILESLIDEACADIVEFAGYRGESLVWAGLPRRIPMVARVHGRTAWVDRSRSSRIVPRQRLMNQWETRELLSADCLSSVASHLVPTLIKRVDSACVKTIHNGIDALSWSRKQGAGEQLASHDILFVGSHVKSKGVFVLMEAADALRRSGGWDGSLILAGRSGDEFASYLRRHWKTLPGWIRVLGHCPRENLASMYASAGVCCLPSFYEGANYTGLEALASGAILVGSSAGTEELIGSAAGFAVPAGNRPALVAALRTALSLDEHDRQSLRQRAIERVRQQFDIGITAEQTAAWYRGVIDDFYSAPARGYESRQAATSLTMKRGAG